ncbi:MAG: EVE domain-containing protein, partial [Chloroflexota bacterium]
TLHFALCTLHFALCTLHFALCTLHFALCTLHFALCTLHFALKNPILSRIQLLELLVMAYFLAKTEPTEYSIDDLQAAGTDEWDGVANPTAVINLKAMKDGDYVFIYHSRERAIVGLAQVMGDGRADPDLPKSWLCSFRFMEKYPRPIASLADVKAAGEFNDWALVRISRLSVMPVPESFLTWLTARGVTLPGV